MKQYLLCFGCPLVISQPLAFTVDITFDNQLLTGLCSGIVSLLTTYMFYKFKKK